MYKIIGLIMIFTASFMTGNMICLRKTERVGNLDKFAESVLLFKNNVKCRQCIFSDNLREVSIKSRRPVDNIFRYVYKKWSFGDQNDIDKLFSESFNMINKSRHLFEEKDIRILGEFVKCLGQKDVHTQVQCIEMYEERLKAYINDEKRTLKDRTKVIKNLAVMTGIFIDILLI